MAKFKVGDRVRVTKVDADDPYKVGDQGVVLTNLDVSGILVIQFIEGYLEYASPYQLELVWRPVTKNRNWWETPEGIEWLSTQQDVEEQFLKSQEKKEEKTYRVGQRFVVSCEGVALECILAQVGAGMVCLINLESGNRLHEPVRVLNSQRITEDGMGMIAKDCSFQLL